MFTSGSVYGVEGWKLNSACRFSELFWGQDLRMQEMRDERALLPLGGDSPHRAPADPPETGLPGYSLVGVEAGSPKGCPAQKISSLNQASCEQPFGPLFLGSLHAAFLRARTLFQRDAELQQL